LKLFQNSGLNRAYHQRLDLLNKSNTSFSDRINTFLADRYNAVHILDPIYSNADAFFTNADDRLTQLSWAKEKGISANATDDEILLNQIEEHKPDVFYNLDPMKFDSSFVKKIPSSVKYRVAWRAVLNKQTDISAYDLIVSNFPGILESFEQQGCKTAYFCPSHDPYMDSMASSQNRDIDVLFIGSYSRHHVKRAKVIEAVSTLSGKCNIQFHLAASKYTKVFESKLNILNLGSKYQRPNSVKSCSYDPLYGIELLYTIGRSKIVLNGAIDMSGIDKGNMRCFEALGCGACMVTDRGNYPSGFVDGENYVSYDDHLDAVDVIKDLLSENGQENLQRIAKSGYEMISKQYSKARQWDDFVRIVNSR